MCKRSGNNRLFPAYTEADIIVPDIKPDIAKVLQVDANAVVTSKECQTDKFVAEGKVSINILYIGDDNTVKSINSVQNFRHSMEQRSGGWHEGRA
jgi:hypothetical protein